MNKKQMVQIEFTCTRCHEEIVDGESFISTGNGKKYHHPKCSEGVPIFRHWERIDTDKEAARLRTWQLVPNPQDIVDQLLIIKHALYDNEIRLAQDTVDELIQKFKQL